MPTSDERAPICIVRWGLVGTPRGGQGFIAIHLPEMSKDFREAFAQSRSESGFPVAGIGDALNEAMSALIRHRVAILRQTRLKLRQIRTFRRWLVLSHPVPTQLKALMTALAGLGCGGSAGVFLQPPHHVHAAGRLSDAPRCPMGNVDTRPLPAPESVETNHA